MGNKVVTINWADKTYTCELAPVIMKDGGLDCHRGAIKDLDMIIEYEPGSPYGDPYPWSIWMDSSQLNEAIFLEGSTLQDTVDRMYFQLDRIRDYLNEIL